MAQRIAIWYGTDRDLAKLKQAVQRNCECVPGETTCAPHEMLADQDTLNHLVFGATRRNTYRHGEFDPASEWF